MKDHEAGRDLGPFLSTCLTRMLTVAPSSVQPEREFSIMNSVCTKIRNSLSPATLDDIVILRSFYKKNKSD